ncbi:No apical meristem (NAM) protein [Corchorus olitorius]|uniref:No apical meristem (NAM) protein n=1 Tax=Corchorus olitorius TaxID=93759 RepID=A0A1R3IIE9_9ROSI|nr:No apical meristem (NAM) protein [Corchorus olitorius]
MSSCCCNDTVGYRFHPTDKELVDHYLWNKALDRDSAVQAIGDVHGDICDWEPEDLPRFSVQRSNDQVWYLFCRRNQCKRVKRTTKLGYWKLTGKHRRIKANVGIGTKKTLVFYQGRPKGKWTPWVIHEYTLPDTLPNQKGIFLCKLKKKHDEKAGLLSGEEDQPSNVEDDKDSNNSMEIYVEDLLTELDETKGSDEVASAQKTQISGVEVPPCNAALSSYDFDGNFDGIQNQSSTNEHDDELHSSTLLPDMHEEHVPSCDNSSVFYGFNGDFDGVQNQSSSNKHDDELHSSTLIPQMHEEHVPSCDNSSVFCGFNGDFDRVQNQSSTNEQDDELHSSTLLPYMHEEYVPSCDNSSNFSGFNDDFDGVQNQSSANEEDDELWNNILVDENDAYPDEGSNQLVVGVESSDLLAGNLEESSRKRLRVDDSGLDGVTETEVSQARVKKRPLI